MRYIVWFCLAGIVALLIVPNAAHAATVDTITFQFSGIATPISDAYIGLFNAAATTASAPTTGFEGDLVLSDVPAGSSSQTFIISPAANSQIQNAPTSPLSIDSFTFAGVLDASNSGGVAYGYTQPEAGFYIGSTYYEAYPSATLAGTSVSDVIVQLQQNSTAFIPSDLSLLAIPSIADSDRNDLGITPIAGGTAEIVNFGNEDDPASIPLDAAANGTITASFGTETLGGGTGNTGGSTGGSGPSTVPLPSAAWPALAVMGGLFAIGFVRRQATCE